MNQYTPEQAINTKLTYWAKCRHIDEADGLVNIADRSTQCKDMQSDEIDAKTAEIASTKVKKVNKAHL